MWGSESSLYNIYSSAHTACWKTRNGGNVGFTRIMKNAWTPLIWELVIWAFKQWNRQIDKQKPNTHSCTSTSASTCTAKSLTKERRVWRFQLLSVTSIHFLFVFLHTFVLLFIHFFRIIDHIYLNISSWIRNSSSFSLSLTRYLLLFWYSQKHEIDLLDHA